MVSVVRLLPRHKVTRNGVPYTKLLAWVLNARFFSLLKFLAFVSLPFCFLQQFSLGPAFFYRYLCFHFVLLAVLLTRKVRIVTFAPTFTSYAQEVMNTLLRPSSWVLAATYTLSALVYIGLFASGSDGLFKVVKVDLPPTPPGLPRNLESRPFGNLRVVNQDYCFRHYFAVYAGILYAAYHILTKFDVLPAHVRVEAPWRRLRAAAPATLISGSIVASAIVLSWPIVYFAVHTSVLRLFFLAWGSRIQGETSFPTVSSMLCASYHFWFLILAWQISNVSFTVYMSLGPFHRGHTISSSSQDPNGSLISGFQHRSGSLTELTAWQELLFISQQVEQRRKDIFKDVDSDRVVWKLIHAEYTKVVASTVDALDVKPKVVAQPPESKPASETLGRNTVLNNSSCLFSRPATNTTLSPLKTEHKDVFVRARISPSARFIDRMQDPKAAKSQQAVRWFGMVVPDIKKPLKAWLLQRKRQFLLSIVGLPFRATTSREAQAMIPQSGLLSLALESVARLIVASHDEDPFGYVQVGIASTLAQLDRLLTLLDKVINRENGSWKDVAVQEGLETAGCDVLLAVRETAATAFVDITAKFGRYFDDLKVSDAVKQRAQSV